MLTSEQSALSIELRRREALAWAVIWASFLLFCILISAIAWGAFWYRNNAVIQRKASLSVLEGTILVRQAGEGTWSSADDGTSLKTGDSIKTDMNGQAFITLFDGSTIRVFSGSEMQLKKMTSSRFSSRGDQVSIYQSRGKLQLGVAIPAQGERDFLLMTSAARITLGEGSFLSRIDGDTSMLHVRERGQASIASITAANRTVSLKEGEWSQVAPPSPPTPPLPLSEELVFNGDFAQGMAGWQVLREYGFPEGQGVEGKVEQTFEEGRLAMRFAREGSKGTHFGVFLFQDLDKDVSDFSSLKLSLRMKLTNQSLAGGGYMGSEYPLMVRVDYRFPGGQTYLVYSFYYQNDEGNRTDTGTQVAQGEWIDYTIPDNLLSTQPRPQRLIGIQVGASGWDFDSSLSRISLTGE